MINHAVIANHGDRTSLRKKSPKMYTTPFFAKVYIKTDIYVEKVAKIFGLLP
jgi:hypothetical protein